MTDSLSLARTPLYDEHVAGGGRLVPFAGWELPIQYDGVIAEHTAVRTSAGLFDVSHMGQLVLTGPGARDDLQRLLSNDIGRLTEAGRAQYSLLTNERGGIVDDLIVYRRAGDEWLLVVNAGNRAAAIDFLGERVGADTTLSDVSDDWAMLALQGPRALDVLRDVTGIDLTDTRPFRLTEASCDGHVVLAATTGYTGERGCELLVAPADAPGLWRSLIADERVTPAGLGARDTLRLEAGYCLHGSDITTETSAVAAGLDWACAFGTDFTGRETLFSEHTIGSDERLVALQMTGRGIPRAGCLVEVGAGRIGRVTSGTMSPTLGMGIALAYVRSDMSAPGTQVDVDVRGTRYPAVVAKKPLYRREATS